MRTGRCVPILALILIAGMLGSVFSTAQAAKISVTSTANSGAGSLRQAVLDATAGDTIEIGELTIVLADSITIDKNLTIRGTSGNRTTAVINGGEGTRLFVVSAGATVVLEDLTVAHGKAEFGGAVLNHGILTLMDCLLQVNQAIGGEGGAGGFGGGGGAGLGGAIFNDVGAQLTLDGCALLNNTSTGGSGGGGVGVGVGGGGAQGAAIYNMDGGTVDTLRITLTGNIPDNLAGEGSFGVAEDVAAPEPEFAVNPTSLNFGEVAVGDSAEQVLIVSNTGSDTLILGSGLGDLFDVKKGEEYDGSLDLVNGDFDVRGDDPIKLPGGHSLELTFLFKPVSVGTPGGYTGVRHQRCG